MRISDWSSDVCSSDLPDLQLKGHVQSIGAGTGSEFSVIPAQNANGNWVKVTQRIPVRIAIDSKSSRPLIAGMSAQVKVDVRTPRRCFRAIKSQAYVTADHRGDGRHAHAGPGFHYRECPLSHNAG